MAVYIESFCSEDLNVTLESLIVLHVLEICDNITLYVVPRDNTPDEPLFKVEKQVHYVNAVPDLAKFSSWPVLIIGNTVVAGLASVTRQLVKFDKETVYLLGFRESCLVACNETSIWTKFCEIDVPTTVKNVLNEKRFNDEVLIPAALSRYEHHMSQPIRVHNVYKLARIQHNDKLIKSSVPVEKLNLEHRYSEGTTITLADILLYPCFKIFVDVFGNLLQDHFPLTLSWFDNLQNDHSIPKLAFTFHFENTILDRKIILEPAAKQSLYVSDPKRYKPQSRIYTRQIDVENALGLIPDLPEINYEPFGHSELFSWSSIPLEINPIDGGALPASRASRKAEQLENLAKATLAVVKERSCTIVDFCSGSGHLGLLIAVLLPNCHVVLVENKERSLQRAQERITKLNLTNVSLVQSNLDYLQASFDVGLALHACGVATDLVIQTCIKNNADFVCCPCCYGGIHNCQHVKYPRSLKFKQSLTYRDYLFIGHSADQTHDEDNAKTKQGFVCMQVIDTDRKRQAEECGYEVHLGKLQPPSCTPKNNLLVGICRAK